MPSQYLRFWLPAVAAGVFCTFGAIDAMAAGLITPVEAGAAAQTEAPAAEVETQQLVRIDAAGLVAALSASHTGAPVVLDLLPGVSVPLVVVLTDPAPRGMSAFGAHSPGDAASSSTIVVDDGTVYAVIQYKNSTYEISHLSNGIHKVTKINQDKFPGDEVIEGRGPSLPPPSAEALKTVGVAAAAEPAAGNQQAAVPGNTVIDVTIISTLKARTHHPDWLRIARDAVMDANMTFSNSRVRLTFRITRLGNLFNYDETNRTYVQMLADLSAAPGVHAWRDSTRSDLVAIFRDDTGLGRALCGKTPEPLPDPPTAATSAQAYSIVRIDCAVRDHSYVHEAGHNMGLRHDRFTENARGRLQAKYNYGFTDPTHRVYTVMATFLHCMSQGVMNCTRVAFLSNPFLILNGGPLGVNVGSIDPAYNARRLGETKAIIAGYRR